MSSAHHARGVRQLERRAGEPATPRIGTTGVKVARAATLLFLLALLLTSSSSAAQRTTDLRRFVGTRTSATVTSVADGDTVNVSTTDGTTLTVRLDGIDTPERGEPYSTQATRATRVMLLSKRVQLQGTDVDRYGRLVARVVVDGVDSSLQLVRDGLACHFTRYSSDVTLAAAQSDAQRRGAGFWAQGVPKPACAVSTQKPQAPPGVSGPFHGNTSSRVFHAPSCRNYNCRNCTAVFATQSAAEAAGFKPAGDCIRSEGRSQK